MYQPVARFQMHCKISYQKKLQMGKYYEAKQKHEMEHLCFFF